MKKQLEIVAALIKNNGKVLLAQRLEDDAYGMLWEFPGGKVENGETDEQALAREMREELGIEVKILGREACYEDESEVLKINVRLYRCNIISGEPSALECRDWGWFSLEEALNLDLAPADEKAYRLLAGKMSGNNKNNLIVD